MENFTKEEVAALKALAAAYSNAKTIEDLDDIDISTDAYDVDIEVVENGKSVKANVGDLLEKTFLTKDASKYESLKESAAYYIAIDGSGNIGIVDA